MSDFFQNGVITTLHKLRERSIESIEDELHQFAKISPMALILPSLFSELEGEALPNIVNELKGATYISDIIVGLDQASEEQFRIAKSFFDDLPQKIHILWNDGERLRTLDNQLMEINLAPTQPGKGRNVWYCIGYTLALDHIQAIALHDCDILTYDRSLVARLFYPVASPRFNFSFCKGYYARIDGNKLSGRMTRLFVTPLIRSLSKVLGFGSYLEYMDSFRYPLSGEFSFRKDFVKRIRIPGDWGLEIGVLSEVYRNLSSHQICQVDIADQYDHKHQVLTTDDRDGGLERMSVEIAKSFFRKIATEGFTLSVEDIRSIKACYFRTALDFVEQYYYDAKINGLEYHRHSEEGSIELFAQCIMTAGESFLENPMETPFIPNWNRILSAIPDFSEQLKDAVRLDAAET